jgi:hypothetical protein
LFQYWRNEAEQPERLFEDPAERRIFGTELNNSLIFSIIIAVPGQDFCFWTGEDMSQIQFPVTEVRVGEFDAIHQELLEGAEIEIHMTSEGK